VLSNHFQITEEIILEAKAALVNSRAMTEIY